jgi:hypothetical protein
MRKPPQRRFNEDDQIAARTRRAAEKEVLNNSIRIDKPTPMQDAHLHGSEWLCSRNHRTSAKRSEEA